MQASPPVNVSQGFGGYGEPIGSQNVPKDDQQQYSNYPNKSQYNVTY